MTHALHPMHTDCGSLRFGIEVSSVFEIVIEENYCAPYLHFVAISLSVLKNWNMFDSFWIIFNMRYLIEWTNQIGGYSIRYEKI